MSKVMRSLGIFGIGGKGATALSAQRPEVLRRKTIANNARLMIAASMVLMPLAMWALIGKSALGFALACVGLTGGMLSLALYHRGRHDDAALAQVVSIIGAGVVLTLVDSRLADMGLTVTLMGPILAALLADKTIRLWSWLSVGGVLLFGAIGSWLSVPTDAALANEAMIAGTFAFGVAVALVAHTTHTINAGYVVHDKAQINTYRHLVDNVQDTVLSFSAEGDILSASPSAEALFGSPRYQLSSASLGERIHVMDRPAYLTAFADANYAGRSRTIEVRMRRDDPHGARGLPLFIWVEVRFSPLKEQTGNGRFEVTALMRDITERKDAEASMAEAKRSAEEALQAKSRFLATIGHELRTPLNAVVGFSEMMTTGIGGELSPTHREYAGLIHQSGKHLLDVVGMLLDMSRIEAGKFEIITARFQPDEIVPACFAMVESMAKGRSITLLAEIEPDLPSLLADERACRQILINLLSNAIKFSHEGDTVTLVVKRQGQSLSFAVRDQGIGMAPVALERIGEPFFQAQDGLNRQYEGTGLGLSIVKGLAELHGGTLRAMSEIGAGTTMTVLLPINGPATKLEETVAVLPLHRETASTPKTSWQNEKRKAQ
ncbi:PAS domain-containing sensor histidine kinase [Devosia soli]|uniref:PAS domain-containing sensor histidine kinase n=1 Tax=Devosia soli TaxID=361041 RepID=UPI001AEBD557|nr:PAS domain-containing sensor histidine kinase [Devosia soli]